MNTTATATGSFVFSVEGYAVRYDSAEFSGLHTVYRGHCPFSETGYFSLSCHRGADRASIEAAANSRASETAKRRADVIRTLSRSATSGPAPANRCFYSRVGTYYFEAEQAFAHGLYVAPDMRASLWTLAIRVLDRVLAERGPFRFGGAWTPEHGKRVWFHCAVLRTMLRAGVREDWARCGRMMKLLPHPVMGWEKFLQLPEPPRETRAPVFEEQTTGQLSFC